MILKNKFQFFYVIYPKSIYIRTYKFNQREIHRAYWQANYQNYILCLEFIIRFLVILSSILFGISLSPLSEDYYQPVVWTIMLMLWHIPINKEDLAIDPYLSTHMNATFISWFLIVVKSNLKIPRGGRLILDEKPKGY